MSKASLAHRNALPGLVALLLLTTWLYAPALGLGFIWDDPLWFGRVAGKSFWELVGPTPDFQFYRPGTMLYNRLFLKADNTFDIPSLHAAQIGWHLLNIALVYAISRRIGLGRWTALAASALTALHPFSHQAVAWAAPQQPMVGALQSGAWLAFLQARRNSRACAGVSLLLFAAALVSQESTVALAGLPLILDWALRRRRNKRTIHWLALSYPALAAAFALVWALVPRQAGFVSLAFRKQVTLYLLQGFIFPLLGKPAGYATDQTIAAEALVGLGGLIVGLLVLSAWRGGKIRAALVGLAWAVLGIAPALAGLRYVYVSLSPRLFYYSAPGVALLWACALPRSPTNAVLARLWKFGGAALFGLVILQSGLLLSNLQQMYAGGAAHLARAVNLLASNPNARLLFINFPDRIEMRPSPYPLGFWGITLAPVVQDLADYARVHTGRSAQDKSLSDFLTGADERQVWPYRVDMRGAHTDPAGLFQAAVWADAVYLTRYRADGTLDLQHVGKVRYGLSTGQPLATLGDAVQLVTARIDMSASTLTLELVWDCLRPLQVNDTVFVHFWQGSAHVANADGDSLGGMIPLYVWSPGAQIVDVRHIDISGWGPGQYKISVGLYNRESSLPYPALDASGARFHYDEIPVGAFSLP